MASKPVPSSIQPINPINEQDDDDEEVLEEEEVTSEENVTTRPRRNTFSFWGAREKEKIVKRSEFDEKIAQEDMNKYVQALIEASEGWESFGWEFVGEERGVTITRTSFANSTVKCIKGVSVIKATPKEVFEVVSNISLYKEFDPKTISESKVIHSINNQLSTNYMEFAAQFPVSGRDTCFIQYRTRQNDGSYIVAWNSVKDPEMPKRKGIVRAMMANSGFVIVPLQTSSLVTFVLQFDLKGWLPSTLMNQMISNQPMILALIEDYIHAKASGTSVNNENNNNTNTNLDSSTKQAKLL